MIDEVVATIAAARLERAGARPLVVAIGGGVGVGKTTLARTVAAGLRETGLTVAELATDNFLFPNEELKRRGLLFQKGFPDTYDVASIARAVGELRRGRVAVVPLYSHDVYDVVDSTQSVPPTDVLIIEGVNALQPEVAALADLSIYVDVDDEDARRWFFARFHALAEKGDGFYAQFANLDREARESVATSAWSGINFVNLIEHIRPTQSRADITIRKRGDHSIVEVKPTRD